MITPQAYPLQWPAGWPRTEANRRDHSNFKATTESALKFLRHEIELMGGKNVVLSSNCTLGQDRPSDPGVVAYFLWQGQQFAIPCDRWTKVACNVQAIAKTVEAMRGMERWGAKHMIKAMFSGFKALPERAGTSAWWAVLGVDPTASRTVVEEAYHWNRKSAHPDAGGTHEAFIQVQQAWETYNSNAV